MRPNCFNKPISKRFIDAFPKFKREAGDDTSIDYFWETWQNSDFYISTMTEAEIKEVYIHLKAKFYNWHFIYLDDMGISMNVMHEIHEYYPNVLERLKLAKDIRDLSIDEFKKSGVNINSSGQNPKVEKAMNEMIDIVDSQSASFMLKSEEQALRAKFNSLVDGIFDEFIDRFKYMFVKLYTGLESYIYSNEEEGDDEE